MAKKRSKSRRRRPSTYQPKATAPKPKEQAPASAAPRPRKPSAPQQRPVYTGRHASHLAAMDIDNDQVMYSYVKKDLTRIGILASLMFGTLIVLKILGVS